ncbi:MAG: hypothetical protein IKD15_00125 [Clostridia bacterium]|nr:hypothetical protein [Clostridia bacterium]
MKKKIPMLLALVMSATTFAACNLGKQHEHTFGDSWTVDANQHWHAATCEHGEEKKDAGNHADANEDGKCDVCDYEVGHTHTFEETWSKDDTHHWYAATCTHTDEKSNHELHTDANEDGVCDVCEGHVHIVNDAGYCDGCDTQVTPIDKNNIEAVINAMLAQSNHINGGEVVYSFNSVAKSIADGNGKNAYSDLNATIHYTLGNNATYVEHLSNSEVYNKSDLGGVWQLGQAESLTKTWFYVENGEIQGFEELHLDGVVTPQFVTADEDNFAGYYFAVSTLADGWGAETVLFNLYTLSQESSASDYVVVHDADKKTYTFTFNSLIINTDTAEGEGDSVRYYETSVSFGYSDNLELTSLNIQCDAYTNDAGTNAGEADVDYDYDQANKTITMRDGASPDTYTFAVTQTVGERTYVHEKDISVYMPKSFTFEVENGATLEYEAMEDVSIEFDAVPTESFDLVKVNGMINATLTCNDGDSSSYAYIFIDVDGKKYIDVSKIVPGSYTLAFTYLDETIWSVSINVKTPIIVGEFVSVEITDNNTFDGQLVSFEAPASGTYTFNIPAGYGAVDKEEHDFGGFNENPYVDPNVTPNGGSFSVDIAKGDTYEFYLSAPSKGTHIISYTFEAKEVVGGDDDENEGDFDYATVLKVGSNTLYFSPEEIEADTAIRSMIITEENPYKLNASNLFIQSITNSSEATIVRNDDYTYTLPADTYTIKFAMLSAFGVRPNEPNSLEIKSAGVVAPTPVGNLYEDDNTLNISDDNISTGYVLYNFMPWNDGEYVFTADFDCIVMNADGDVIGTNNVTLSSYTPYTVKLDVASLTKDGKYTVNIKWLAPLGSQGNPHVITALGDYTANYAGDSVAVWYVYTPAADGTLTITNGSDIASIMCGAAFGYENAPVMGDDLIMSVVGGMAYYIGVAAWETTEAVELSFNVAFEAGTIERDGTRNAPFVLELGDKEYSVPAWDCAIYAYTATANGTLKATTSSTNFDFNFSDTVNGYDFNVENTTVSIDVVAGQTVYLFVATADMSASVLNINVTFEELVIIDVTTMEGNGTTANPYVLTGVGKYDMGTVNAYPGYVVSITVTEATTLVISADVAQLYSDGWNMLADAGVSYTKTLDAGATFVFIVCMETGTADVVLTVANA